MGELEADEPSVYSMLHLAECLVSEIEPWDCFVWEKPTNYEFLMSIWDWSYGPE